MVLNNHSNGNGDGPAIFVDGQSRPETHIPTTVDVGQKVLLTWDIGNGTGVSGVARALLALVPIGNVAVGPNVSVPGFAGDGNLAITVPVEWTVDAAPGQYTAVVSIEDVSPNSGNNPNKLNVTHQFSFTVSEPAAQFPEMFVIGGPFIT